MISVESALFAFISWGHRLTTHATGNDTLPPTCQDLMMEDLNKMSTAEILMKKLQAAKQSRG